MQKQRQALDNFMRQVRSYLPHFVQEEGGSKENEKNPAQMALVLTFNC